MPGLLYFLPDQGRGVKLPDLQTIGLGYAFERNPTPRECQRGPDGHKGVVVVDPSGFQETHLIGYFPEKQAWRKIPPHPSVVSAPSCSIEAYVGVYRDPPPTPAELLRRRTLRGHLVTLGDGQQYEIPVARGWSDDEEDPGWYMALPQATDLDEEGNWTRGGVVAAYAPLWDVALRWWDAMVAAEEGSEQEDAEGTEEEGKGLEFEFAQLNDAALLALSTNYRLGKAEVALLGLFSTGVPQAILQATVDWPTLTGWLKKKHPPGDAGLNTDAGPPATQNDTAPP